jgi:hypothetical protein
MKKSIGGTFLYNSIFAFLIITFALLAGAISYSKAFRVNSRIINAIEKYEGYNINSALEINRVLSTIGYTNSNFTSSTCPQMLGANAMTSINNTKYEYCIYAYSLGNNNFSFGVLTYIYFDVPVLGEKFKVRVFSRSDGYYRFPIIKPRATN